MPRRKSIEEQYETSLLAKLQWGDVPDGQGFTWNSFHSYASNYSQYRGECRHVIETCGHTINHDEDLNTNIYINNLSLAFTCPGELRSRQELWVDIPRRPNPDLLFWLAGFCGTFAERLSVSRWMARLPPKVIYRNLGISGKGVRGSAAAKDKSQYSKYEQGGVVPRVPIINSIAHAIGVSPDWLRHGSVPYLGDCRAMLSRQDYNTLSTGELETKLLRTRKETALRRPSTISSNDFLHGYTSAVDQCYLWWSIHCRDAFAQGLSLRESSTGQLTKFFCKTIRKEGLQQVETSHLHYWPDCIPVLRQTFVAREILVSIHAEDRELILWMLRRQQKEHPERSEEIAKLVQRMAVNYMDHEIATLATK